ncbi:MopE-related protein [Snuella lapsa]|uniref:Secretion system C-terminal sorting domain-containing protein n=1 Tax=Snuella lapsa TaxID=870481 RepID=A0ABP6YGQ0_9FLAO
MEKLVLLIFMLATSGVSFSQCLNTSEYTDPPIPVGVDINDGEQHQIAIGIEAGQYVEVTGLNSGDEYKFTSNRTDTNNPNTDFITIRDGADLEIVYGTSPLAKDPIGTATIRIHINLDSGCGTDEDFHTLTIQNLSAATCNMPGAPGGISYKSDARIDFYWSPPALSTPTGYNWQIVPSGNDPGDDIKAMGSTTAPTTEASSGSVLMPGTSYWIYVQSSCASNETSGWFKFPPTYVTNSASPPDNDFCDGAIKAVQDINTDFASEATPIVDSLDGGAGTDVAAENCNGTTGNARDDVWYWFLAQTASVTITLDPTFDGVLTLYSGDCNTLSYLDCSDDPNTTLADEEIIAGGLTVGQRYYVRVYYKGTTTPVNPTFDLRIWSSTPVTDDDMDGYVDHIDVDCDDDDPAIHPDATEIPDNGIDEDCDGADLKTWYLDADEDNYGDINETSLSNTQPDGYVANSMDCDDTNNAVHPDATEVCDTIDNDCDGLIDDVDPSVTGQTTYYVDSDQDGYGDENDSGTGYCSDPGVGYSLTSNDCNDNVAAIHPDATEISDNGIDDDCDGMTDETLALDTFDFDKLIIRPNPFNSNIVIEIPNMHGETIDIAIFDISGRIILRSIKQGIHDYIEIDHLDTLQNGIYLLKISTPIHSSKKIIRRIVKL